MNSNLFLLDKDKDTVGVLSNRMPFSLPFFDDLQERSLDDLTDILTLNVPATHSLAEQITTDMYILYPTFDEGYKLYKIKEITETSDDNGYSKELYCEVSAQDDLIKSIVKPTTFKSASLDEVLSYILQGTGWAVGQVDEFELQDYKIEDYTNALEALVSAIQAFGGELQYEYDLLPNSSIITGQQVSVYEQVGQETGLFFTHGKDVQGVERIEDTSQLVTALMGVGKADDAGVALTFEKYSPTLPKGFERGADWLGSTDALERYSNGEHIMGVFKDDNAQSPAELFRNTLEALKKYSKPLMTYKVSLILLEKLTGYEHMLVRLGDTIVVQDETVKPALYVKARVRKLSRSITNPINDGVELGDYIPIVPPVNKRLADIQSKIRAKEETWNKAEEIPAIQEKLEQVPTMDDLFSTPNQRLKVRYIRDYINGSTANASNHWVELQVLRKGENIAKGIIPTGSSPLTNPEYLTDGIVDSSRFTGASSGLQYVQLDLGAVVSDVEYLQVWHYYDDSRGYKNHYVDVSEDGLLWIRMYNSDKGGIVDETEKGFIVPINSSAILSSQKDTVTEIVKDVENLEDFKQSAEYQLTQKVDLVAYNKKINELNQSIADKAGLEYVDGQLISKADVKTVEDLTAEVANKAGLEYVDGQLIGKADTADVDTVKAEVAKKAGLTYVDGKLADKANVSTTYTKTEVDKAVNSKVSSTTYTTDMNGIVSRLDSQDTAIEQNESEIALKASQDTVDEIEGRVTDAEATLSVQADQIASKVTQSSVDTGVASAKTYADSKDATNLTTAKTYADGKASTAESNAKKYSDGKLAPVVTRVTNAETAITQNAEAIELKAEKSTVDTLSTAVEGKADSSTVNTIGQRVTTAEGKITANATAINQRVTKTQYTTDVNGIVSRLDTAEASIETQAGQIALKASQDSVDSLEGRVESAEASLTVQAGQIASKVTQTEVNKGVSDAKTYADSKDATNLSSVKTYADSKASTAEGNAKTYADGKISPLTTRVTNAETSITQNKSAIALKASQADMDTVETDLGKAVTRLSNAESTLSVHSTEISAKASQSSVNSLTGRVSTAEGQLKVQAGQIATKVTKDEAKAIAKAENRVDFRYVRYIGDGNTVNDSTHILELAVYDSNRKNVANGILPTSGATDATNLAWATNGVTNNTNEYANLGKSQETQWMMIDLGKVYSDIDSIKIWHYFGDTRQYRYNMQVSEDGINWISMYDTAVSGMYNATSAGFEIFVNQQKAIFSFASQFTQTADALSLKADSETVDDLGNRVASAEEMITPEAIVSTVTSSDEYVGAMDEKANATDLDSKVNAEDLDAVKADIETNYATKAEITQTATDIDFMFQSAGGVNLIKNSVGFAGKDFWTVSGLVDTGQPIELEQRGAGSGFYMKGGKLKQSVAVRGGTYTVSAIVKKSSTGTGYLKATFDNAKTKQISFNSGTALDYEVVNFVITVEGTQIDIELYGTADSGIIFTSLMMNVGAMPLQWSHATGEVYSTNIQFNENGITVKNSEYDGYTAINSEEFSGYYNSTGIEGQYEEVFSLNKDTTMVNKLNAKQEISMNPVKIVPIQAGTLNGLAFVASDE